jgi:hypothetical protein
MSLALLRENIGFLIFGLLILGGIAGLSIVTQSGIGASPDSVAYIGAAKNLLDGHGLSLPYGEPDNPAMTHHAPLYPLLLALSGSGGWKIMDAAKWINIILFIINIGIVFFILRSISSNFWLPMAGCTLILASPAMIQIHAMAWTEPLFISLSTLGLYVLSRYLGNGRRMPLVMSGILLGLAFLTRYAGAVLIATGMVVIILLGRKSLRQKLLDVLVFGGFTSLPMILWMARNKIVTKTATNREFLFHPLGKAQLMEMLGTFSGWVLIPERIPALVRGILLIALSIAVIWIIYVNIWNALINKKYKDLANELRSIPPIVNVFVIYIISYIGFLVFSVTFIDANTPFDERILSPVYNAGVILIVYTLDRLLKSPKTNQAIKITLVALLSIAVAIYIVNAAGFINTYQSSGLGFNSVYWREAEILQATKNLPADITIYTNVPEVVYLYTGRSALRLPKPSFALTKQVNPEYQADLSLIRDRLQSNTGVIVYFSQLAHSSRSEESGLIDTLNLCLYESSDEGNLYLPEKSGLPCRLSQEGSS